MLPLLLASLPVAHPQLEEEDAFFLFVVMSCLWSENIRKFMLTCLHSLAVHTPVSLAYSANWKCDEIKVWRTKTAKKLILLNFLMSAAKCKVFWTSYGIIISCEVVAFALLVLVLHDGCAFLSFVNLCLRKYSKSQVFLHEDWIPWGGHFESGNPPCWVLLVVVRVRRTEL